jgi:hypothetical protein
MGKKTIQTQIHYRLSSLKMYGTSRNKAKEKLRDNLGADYRIHSTTKDIHGIGTFISYKKRCGAFAKWCVSQGADEYAWLKDLRPYVEPFLQARIDAGLSVYTVKQERSALGKLYGERIEYSLPERKAKDIKRSRHSVEMDKHFSPARNRDLVILSKATGGRREDMGKIMPEHFEERDGRLYVNFYRSKGGRDRLSPVLPELEGEVRKMLEKKKAENREHEPIFKHVHTKADIHGYRREYAKALYKAVTDDPRLRDELLRPYPPRREPKVKSAYYKTRSHDVNQTFLRDALYVVTQALGHNRLEVAVTNYLS